MKREKFFFVFISVLLLLLMVVWLFALLKNPKALRAENNVVFSIEKGKNFIQIGSDLEKAGLIKSKVLFDFLVLTGGSPAKLLAGKYELKPSMSVSEILNKIIAGETVKEKITIIEGWNLNDIGNELEKKGIFKKEDLFEIAGFPVIGYSQNKDLSKLQEFVNTFEFLREKPENLSLEGYLFPDTYEFNREDGLAALIEKTVFNFNKKITQDLREQIEKQGKSLFEVLILASLLEKEVKTEQDKRLAAGILWKRLKAGWPLQVDATLGYITDKPSQRLTLDDLTIDSPYNTYKYFGLPIGPICNPGIESIKAAVYFQDNPYWFYLSTPEGKIIFSETLEEHNANKIKYLR